MMHAQNIKYGTLSGLLLICIIMFSMTADSQTSVSAQITPAPEKFGSINDAAPMILTPAMGTHKV